MEECNFEKFNAEKFVDNLLSQGTIRPCDESNRSFVEGTRLPNFYNEALYKRGQKFFNDNIFALFIGKFLGLLSVLAIPSIVSKLIFTKMSGSDLAAYKRYMSTVFHMVIWYKRDFLPGSKLWTSVEEVRQKHNSASKKCCSSGLGRFSQKDMALTQFGFMGFALAKREKIGLYGVADEDLKGFVHIWRVLGFVMGIENEFNICRDSVEETIAICKILAEKVFKPAVERKDKDFLKMSDHLIQGLWCMNPNLNTAIFLNILHQMVSGEEQNNNSSELYIPLTFTQNLVLKFFIFTIWTLQFRVVRYYHNFVQVLSLWLMENCPFLAYYRFGYGNSHVQVAKQRS